MNVPTVIAFDCFGTIFDMSDVPDDEIAAYVKHVKAESFSPYDFLDSWWHLKVHPDAPIGIRQLQQAGFKCVTLSNGEWDLLQHNSDWVGIKWDHIVDLVGHRVYKPNVRAYRTVEKDLGVPPEQTLMVTANPTFGDLEGSASIGMPSQVIRHGYPNTVIELAEMLIKRKKEQ